ncbi:MAG: YggT family protein [Candidatus Cloacimonetes bacterium]|jgi:YggT family protein|nr:YggT family protein [Candidatus Cloacimonadota bacterium]
MLYRLLDNLLEIYTVIIIIRAVISWFSPSPYNPLYRLLIQITEPVLDPIRRIMPNLGGIDLSPILLIFIIHIVRTILLRFLFSTPTIY